MNSYLKPKYQVAYLLATIVIFGGLFSYQIISAQQPSGDLLGKVKNDPGLPLTIDMSPGTPVMITESLSREISDVDFRKLTGLDADSASHFSFPEVKVLNTSGKVITGFSLVLQKNSGRFYFVKHSKLKLEPNDSFAVKPNHWVSSPKVNIRTEGDKVGKISRVLDFDSPEMWIPGRVSDASLIIVGVKFSDGTEWKVKGKN